MIGLPDSVKFTSHNEFIPKSTQSYTLQLPVVIISHCVPPAGVMCLSQVSLGILALKLEKAGAVALVDRSAVT